MAPTYSSTSDDIDVTNILDAWRQMWDRFPDTFDTAIRPHIKIEQASRSRRDPNRARSTFSMTVPRSLCNAGGNLHGGAAALLFDMCTSMTVGAIMREDFWDGPHVSRTLDCVYLRPAPEGLEVLIESEVIAAGKQLCQIRGTISGRADGKIYATCEHGKVWLRNKAKW